MLNRSSVSNMVVAAAGPPGRALVYGDPSVARVLSGRGFRVLLATTSTRPRARPEYALLRATAVAPPFGAGAIDVVVCAGLGGQLRGAAEQAAPAAAHVKAWTAPLAAGGRFILIDRIDTGLLGTRQAASREDLCAALLAARLREIAQAAP